MKRFSLLAGMILAASALTGCQTWWGGSSYGHPMAAQQQPQQDSARPVGASIRAEGHPLLPDNGQAGVEGAPTGALVGFGGMSGVDRSKLNKALDAAPGHTTTWVNSGTGVAYSVTIIRKTTVNNNHLCRVYSVTADHNGEKQAASGTACIADDGAWHTL